ncbi:unnamed protein product [Larinioides sclopetarius]|uniref:Uncharacterized protein n=1 Tax=Larinioides sclopetarius TaxID=280406 RepID=A0AAV1ZQY3_9ARAC
MLTDFQDLFLSLPITLILVEKQEQLKSSILTRLSMSNTFTSLKCNLSSSGVHNLGRKNKAS